MIEPQTSEKSHDIGEGDMVILLMKEGRY